MLLQRKILVAAEGNVHEEIGMDIIYICVYIYVYRNIFTVSVRRNVLILGVDRWILGLFRGTLIRTALGSAN